MSEENGYAATNATSYQYSLGNQGIVIESTKATPVKTPTGLVATRAVETKKGWVGQIIVDRNIVWESETHADEQNAVRAAGGRVIDKLAALFGVS